MFKAGRKDKVEIVAVTKYVEVAQVKEAIDLGIKNIGENRTNELCKKYEEVNQPVNFHMIGHLQTNKVRDIYDKVKLVHSLDRISLAKELDRRGRLNNLIINTLIQVNIAEEESKFGLSKEDVLPFIEKIIGFNNIKIQGLMTIAPYTKDEKQLRSVFRGLYKLREDINRRNYKEISTDYLSMGMTNDYQIAVEEGANIVRIGSGIFKK